MEVFRFIFLGVLVHSVSALSCTSCDKTQCVQPANCKDGLVKGICGCCDVCAKTNGERCGGSWNMYGRCAEGLKCVARGTMEKENDFLPKHFHAGVCEPDDCENKICGFRQTCKINKRGEPVCICPRNCGKVPQPVCGLLNGKQYRNRCKLTREECLTNNKIGFVRGLCKECSYQGRLYKFGAARPDVSPCESCICRHGSWECQKKQNCSMDSMPNIHKRSCLMSQDGKNIVLPCPKDFSCRVQRSGQKSNAVRVGLCKKKKVAKSAPIPLLLEIHNRVDIFIQNENEETARVTEKINLSTTTGSDSLIPTLRTISNSDMPPTITYTKRNQQTGIGLIQRVCMVLPNKATCSSSLLNRWFYNATSKTCEEFQYGGCSGNFNNFVSKEKCEKICYSGLVHNIIRPTPSEKLNVIKQLSKESDDLSEMCHDMKSGKSYREGEKWDIDECTSCSCANGRTECVAPICHTTCLEPTYVKGVCCPICNPQTENSERKSDNKESSCKDLTTGIWYKSGESWKNGECIDCICFEDQISCMKSACSLTYCDNPVKKDGECCSVCPKDEDQVSPTTTDDAIKCQDKKSGKFYTPGEGWTVNDCMSCFCGSNGQSVCHELTCAAPNCKNPVHLQGRCCPICPDSFLSACTYNDHQYFKGDFTLLGDMCTLCKCDGNDWRCNKKHCNRTENRIRSRTNVAEIMSNYTTVKPGINEVSRAKLDDSDNKENDGFVIEDPARMSRRGKNRALLGEKLSATSSSYKEFLGTLVPRTSTTKRHSVISTKTDEPFEAKISTSQSNLPSKNKQQTDIPPLLEEHKDYDTHPVGETNNHTIVYRTKRL